LTVTDAPSTSVSFENEVEPLMWLSNVPPETPGASSGEAQGQRGQGFRGEAGADLRRVSLEARHFGGDLHRLARRAELELNIDAQDFRHAERDASTDGLLESGCLGGDLIFTDLQVRPRVLARFVGQRCRGRLLVLGTTAPVGSVTVPVKVPRSNWALRLIERKKARKDRRIRDSQRCGY
jgi:hypothetical protein